MAFLNPLCSFVLFLLVSVTHVQTQNAECSVDNRFVEIKENNHPGLVITNINADPGITVTIKPSTAAGSPTSEWFEIKGSQLILNERVDFESISVIQLDLICWKGNEEVKKLLVIITIGNENDNAPVFKETNITVDVAEDTKVNTIVVPLANVTATDVDLDVLFYRLKGSPPEAMDYFNIQGINNPQIYLRKALNYEAINFMEFTLSAMDGSAGAAGTHTATATISIRVVESDLRPPWFQPCTALGGRIVCISLGYTSKVNLSEYVSGPLILEPGPLYAIDGERSLNEKVVYEIAAGNDNDTFLINRDSGNITMNKSANTLKTFTLYIVASQDNNPFRYSQTTVKIDVVRKNDNHPYFEKTFYTGRVSVDQPAKTLIMKTNTSSEPLQIFAADDDFLPDKINPDIKYRIQNSSDFRVTADGFIQTTVVLNVSSHITLSAIATDTNTLEEASTLISVDVAPLASMLGMLSSCLIWSNSPATSWTTISYVTSKAAFISSKKPSTQGKVTPSVNESHKTVEPSNPPMSSTTSPEGPYSVEDMAALGATLGSLLAIALALLALMSCKYYKLKKELEKDSLKITEDFSNANFQDDETSNSGGKDDQSPASIMSKSYAEEKEPEGNQTQTAPETIQEEETVDRDSEKEVRSILTKERKMEDDGYKAVWFREDVVPEAKSDIVMIEDDSDLEQSRTGSENDSTAVEDDFSDDTDSGRGDSDINVSPGRAQLLNTNPSASQSLEEAEENDDAL
ncbi:cadherin-related family member 5 [Candoia aspera]|uniref:cadherin-related family member 5 n=1 Tax=Candoia aspera TaxID=51853 RepID=UPI002FD7AD4C